MKNAKVNSMSFRPAIIGVGLVLFIGLTQAANAVPGVATGSVNLRTGPGTSYARIATIPAGAPVNIFRCGRWCDVVYAGRRGWASAAYLARGSARPVYRGSNCHGPDVYNTPFCEWPLERSIREFNESTRQYNARKGRR
jgi:uncharacterized protein YraI